MYFNCWLHFLSKNWICQHFPGPGHSQAFHRENPVSLLFLVVFKMGFVLSIHKALTIFIVCIMMASSPRWWWSYFEINGWNCRCDYGRHILKWFGGIVVWGWNCNSPYSTLLLFTLNLLPCLVRWKKKWPNALDKWFISSLFNLIAESI